MPEAAIRMIRQNACRLRTWIPFCCREACWQLFHTCCGSQSGEDASPLPERGAQVPCRTWISCFSTPFSNRWMVRQPSNQNTEQDGISGFVAGNYISLQIGVSLGAPVDFSSSSLKRSTVKASLTSGQRILSTLVSVFLNFQSSIVGKFESIWLMHFKNN